MFASLSFLILLVGGMVFALETALGNIQGNAIRVMGILMGTATIFLLFRVGTLKGIRSGTGPYDSEGLTFDTKFEDMKLEGRVSGTISGA